MLQGKKEEARRICKRGGQEKKDAWDTPRDQSLLFFFFFFSLSPLASAPPSTSLARLFLLFLSFLSSSAPFVRFAAGVSGRTAVEVERSPDALARALAWSHEEGYEIG